MQSRINGVMVREAQEISDAYSSDRRTELSGSDVSEVAAPEELVPDERCLVIFSTGGHIKRVKDNTFSTQVCVCGSCACHNVAESLCSFSAVRT